MSIRESVTKWLPVESRAPQGSVLFLYYINVLVKGFEYPVLLFADNVRIYKEIKSPANAEALIRYVKRIKEWSCGEVVIIFTKVRLWVQCLIGSMKEFNLCYLLYRLISL